MRYNILILNITILNRFERMAGLGAFTPKLADIRETNYVRKL